MIQGHIKIDAPPRLDAKIRHLNVDPRRRATAGRYINHGTRQLIGIVQEMADAELRTRVQWRRRTQGPRYRDSFKVLPNRQEGIDKMVGGFVNTHHFAKGLEHGVRDQHPIWPSNARRLKFPFRAGSTRSRLGGPPGNWPAGFAKGNARFTTLVKRHPGSPAFKFIGRARARYRRRARGGSLPMSSVR